MTSMFCTHRFVRARGAALLLAGAAAAGAAGCERQIVDGEFATVVVYGQVTQPDGRPAAGVSIAVRIPPAHSCDRPSAVNNATTTGSTGHYRAVAGQFGSRFSACLRVEASPPAGSGLVPTAATRSPVELRSGGADSVRVDVQLERGS